MDWKMKNGGGCHKLYCGIAGEFGHDYEVTDSGKDGVGFGLFALCNFAKNDMIIAERPLIKMSDGQFRRPDFPESAAWLVDLLVPHDGRFQQKWDRNAMSCTNEDAVSGGETGLFLTLSRINHDCLGSADHQFISHRGIKILVASRPIKAGEEVTISYTGGYKPKAARVTTLLSYPYLFQCRCSICTNEELEQKLTRVKELDEAILSLGGMGKIEVAMRKGRALISIYEQMGMSSWLYQRTYYDLFQVAITKKKFHREALHFIRKAHEAILAYTKDENHPEAIWFLELLASPQSHRNYRILG